MHILHVQENFLYFRSVSHTHTYLQFKKCFTEECFPSSSSQLFGNPSLLYISLLVKNVCMLQRETFPSSASEVLAVESLYIFSKLDNIISSMIIRCSQVDVVF